eukprot:161607-Pyramimonas_sp.AAC.1
MPSSPGGRLQHARPPCGVRAVQRAAGDLRPGLLRRGCRGERRGGPCGLQSGDRDGQSDAAPRVRQPRPRAPDGGCAQRGGRRVGAAHRGGEARDGAAGRGGPRARHRLLWPRPRAAGQ